MKKVRVVSLLLVVLILLSTMFSVTAVASTEGTYGNFKYIITDDNTAVISKYIGDEKSVEIPYSINGYTVEQIGNGAFKGCFTLQSVKIPQGVTVIDDFAFNDCTGLLSIVIPDSVNKIGKSAFFYCTRLNSVDVSNGIKTIGDGAFYGCGNLKSFVITKSVESVGEYAFARCKALETVTIENGLTNISNQMFSECEALTSVALPESIENIGRRSFYSCTSVKSIALPNNIKSIDDYAFYNCVEFESVSVPAEKIGNSVFESCSQLKNIEFTGNIKTIGDNAFASTGLVTVTIPSSVTSIGQMAFETNCIENIVVDEANQYYTSVDGVLFNKGKTEIVDYPNYNTSDVYAIPQSVTSIGKYAFSGDFDSLSDVKIPDSVTKIDKGAFKFALSFKDITIPNSVKTIEDEAFYGCSELLSVTIPSSVTEIGDSAFKMCSNLNSIVFSEGLKSIGNYAFEQIYELSSVYFPSSVEHISSTAFSKCENLTNFKVSDSSVYFTVVDGVLYNKEKTELVSYPYGRKNASYKVLDSTKIINDYAIVNLNVDNVTVPKCVESIGKNAIGFVSDYASNELFLKDDFSVYGVSNSSTEKYCVNNNIAFFTDKPEQNISSVSLDAGDTADFVISNTSTENIAFSTSDKVIADVDENGKITANSKGSTQIIANIGMKKFVCTVNVTSGSPKSDDYIYAGFDTSGFSAIQKNDYQKWEDSYYDYNKSVPSTRLDCPAIYCYTTSEYIQIMAIMVGGEYLERTKETLGEDYHQYETIADNLSMELNRYKTNTDMLVYSGTNDVSDITGKTSSVSDMKSVIGKTFVNNGVLSTSIDHGVANNFGDGINHTVLEVYAPASTIKGAYIFKISDFAYEYELLLDKNIEYQVIDAGVRNVSFTGFLTGDITTTERYMKLRIVDNSAPTEPTTIVPSSGATEPSSTDTIVPTTAVQQTTTICPTQAQPTSKPSDSPIATGDKSSFFLIIVLLCLVLVTGCVYSTKRN